MRMLKNNYISVAATSINVQEYIIPNGKTVFFSEFGGDAVFKANVMVCIEFDGVVLFATHGSAAHQNIRGLLSAVGDGIKEIKIKLDNQSPNPETIGAYWKGREHDTP